MKHLMFVTGLVLLLPCAAWAQPLAEPSQPPAHSAGTTSVYAVAVPLSPAQPKPSFSGYDIDEFDPNGSGVDTGSGY